MSLSTQDLTSIRGVVIDALEYIVQPQLDRLEADIKEMKLVLGEHSRILGEHTMILEEHTLILGEHTRLLGEHTSILGEHATQHTGLSRQLSVLDKKVDDIDGRLKAVEADVKELYKLQSKSIPPYISDKTFEKLNNPQKIMTLHKALQYIAKANNS